FGVSTSFVDPRKAGSWKEAVRSDTRLVYIETPANPTMMITDIREAVDAARSVRATTLADNTFASPINQRPIELGVDAVLHSATKYLGGHSDVVAGAVVPHLVYIQDVGTCARPVRGVLGSTRAEDAPDPHASPRRECPGARRVAGKSSGRACGPLSRP
ncbi:MAG: hypothetical protein E6J97_02550, partial [Methanobacteriota archaeon]